MRDSFGSSTDFGDVYYDLAKLYGGMLLPYNLMKNEKNISINCIYENIEFEYKTILELKYVPNYFLKLLKNENYDLNILKTITGLIFINMSPLHDENFSKLLGLKVLNCWMNINKDTIIFGSFSLNPGNNGQNFLMKSLKKTI